MNVLTTSLIAIATISVGTVVGMKTLKKHAPEAEKKALVISIPVVETAVVEKKDLAFPLTSEGIVMTRRETLLSAEVGGRIVKMHPQFEAGASFQEGEIIAEIDQINYEAAVAQAASALADASLALKQEIARSEQAARDWEKIGQGKKASEMVMRVPYLKSAEARRDAAQAGLEKATEDLARTIIRAPFDCRVREVSLNLGATVAPGSRLGVIYDPGKLMVRLPFSLDDFAQIPSKATIQLSADVSGETHHWVGEVLWDGGEIDQTTLSAYLIAEVKPSARAPKIFRLPPPGLFVKAHLSGATLPGVVEIPRKAVRGSNQVMVLNAKSELEFRTLEIARSDTNFLYVTSGVESGDKIILTKIEIPIEGMKLSEARKTDEEPSEKS